MNELPYYFLMAFLACIFCIGFGVGGIYENCRNARAFNKVLAKHGISTR